MTGLSPRAGRRFLQRGATALRRIPNLLHGYNLHVHPEKFRLIDRAFRDVVPRATSFADLGGVWNVRAAYTVYTLKSYRVARGVLLDTDFPPGLLERLTRYPNLDTHHADFATAEAARHVGSCDLLYMFDVLLHQANPDWDEVLRLYADVAPCILIYNQQFTSTGNAVRLTGLPLEEYMALGIGFRPEVCRYVYEHRAEMHPVYRKPWGDVHNIIQWGITDSALRQVMARLGYREVYYRNHGSFLGLTAFQNHAFIFLRH